MSTREELWAQYQRRPRPPHIGDTINGVSLGEIDDDVQDVLGSWDMGPDIGVWKIARLGKAAADLERVHALIADEETREYFNLVGALARAALESISHGEFDRPRSAK